jgi:hypothetical protein
MEFGFVGPSYEAPSILSRMDRNASIPFQKLNPTKAPPQRGVVALYPTPGLTTQAVLNPAEVRGIRTLSGGSQCIVVCGSYVWVMTSNLTPSIIGFLNTTTGRVGISDNGVNAYIVDGAYRYTWRISTPSTATFTGSTSGTTLTVASVSNGTLAVGQQLFGVGIAGENCYHRLGHWHWRAGTYTINISQTVTSEVMYTASAGAICYCVHCRHNIDRDCGNFWDFVCWANHSRVWGNR